MTNRTQPTIKKLVIVKGKGTAKETRIQTDITLYWSKALQTWVTIPGAK